MNIEQNIEELEKKIKKNANKIDSNAEQIERNRYALDILKEFKNDNIRYFTIIIILILLLASVTSYLVYTLNDIGTEETTTQESYDLQSDGNNNFVKGDNNGEIKN